jgi:hypothetical protein
MEFVVCTVYVYRVHQLWELIPLFLQILMNVEAATDAAEVLLAVTLLAATLVPATLDIEEMDTRAVVITCFNN